MGDLHPNKRVSKILISTTSRVVGEFQRGDILIQFAFPDMHNSQILYLGFRENAFSRNYLVVQFEMQTITSVGCSE